MTDKDVDDMDESELKEELKKMYQELNELSNERMERMDFEGKMTLKKKNAEGEVVETRETEI